MKLRNKKTGEIKELYYGLKKDENGNIVYAYGEKDELLEIYGIDELIKPQE